MKQRSETSGTVGRRDLAKAIATGNQETVNAVVSLLGFEQLHLQSASQLDTEGILVERTAVAPSAMPPLLDSSSYPGNIEDIAIWRCVSWSERAPLVKADLGDSRHQWHVEEDAKPASHRLLAGWNEIGPRIRAVLTDVRQGKNPDVPNLVRQVASRQLIVDIPRQKKRQWGVEVHVIRDESIRLSSFVPDQHEVMRQIQAMLPERRLNLVHGGSPAALWCSPRDRYTTEEQELQFGTPTNPSTILVLGDLGCLSRDSDSWRSWLHWGQYQRHQGHVLIALVPCGSKRIVHALHDIYSVQTWQAAKWSVDDPAIREDLIRQILVLAAPTLRLEPGLLRDLRELIPAASDASLEVDAWSSEYMAGVHPDAATIDRDLAQSTLLPEFERLPIELRRQAILCIRNWRLKYQRQPELWFAELLSLSPETRRLLPQQDLDDAKASARQLFLEWRTKSTSSRSERVRVWMYNTTDLFSEFAYEDPDIGWLLRQTRRELHDEPNSVLPGTDLRELPAQSLTRFRIDVADESISLTQASGSTGITLPPSAWIRASVPEIEVAGEKVLRGSAFWKSGKPDFVSQYGTDEFGAWFEFEIPRRDGKGVVTQRMRWIPAGKFLMGSPQGERDRGSNESQHEVKLSRGYWLADTACTQELWEAVTGKTPSHFKGDRRPVEKVSYDEVIKFVSELAKLVPELAPALPTEAQWEYACRADTETPFSFGDTITTDQVNFDGRYPYGDSPKGAYSQNTVEVKSLPPNALGLHEMHGNVWEWCRDWYGKYTPEPQVDPPGPATGSSRVFRGGGWYDFARLVRSAYRYWFAPGYRINDLGFRLLSSASAEPTEAAEVPVAEQGSEQTRFGGADEIFSAKTIRVDEGTTTAEVELSSLGPIRIRSNLEEVFLKRMTKPKWAVEYGRDFFGTYADFEISSSANSPPVCQRMRWIPPGQFQMGSPDTEPGRYDNEIQHAVTISTGFWMFDTPCTQALWLAVMAGENPSYFQDLQRPVEQVGWAQAREFAAELGKTIPGLNFSLPTEAQWEYACRAGTSTAIYTGPLEILGDANAPALDEIAWYGGNCGVDFDLSNGQAVTWLSNKQYDFEKGGTRRVKQKRPNPWGVYDMLGNVWEWCHDWHGDYPSESQIDPMGPEMGSSRVVRGGSWYSSARSVRSAFRVWDVPGARYDFLGFRLLSSANPDRNQPPSK